MSNSVKYKPNHEATTRADYIVVPIAGSLISERFRLSVNSDRFEQSVARIIAAAKARHRLGLDK